MTPKAQYARRFGPWVLAVTTALIVAVHVGLGAFLVTQWDWSLGVVAAIVGAMAIGIAGYHLMRGRHNRRGQSIQPFDAEAD